MVKKPTDKDSEQRVKKLERKVEKQAKKPLSGKDKTKKTIINDTGQQQTGTSRIVSVPKQFENVFRKAEHFVAQYFEKKVENPAQGTIEVSGERYILVRAASMSTEFYDLVTSLYQDRGTEEARKIAFDFLFDLGHALGKADASAFHSKIKVTDPIDKLSVGPVHFAYSGWAFVKILPESNPTPDENYFLIYDHPFSFEADTWMKQGKMTHFPVCTMNAGYSSGWCEESFGLPLVAVEIECRSKGDEHCRFIMASPSKIQGHLTRYLAKPHTAPVREESFPIPEFFERKHAEETLQIKQQTQSVLNKMLSISMKPYSLEEMLNHILDYIVSVPRLTLESKAAIFLVEDKPNVLRMKSSRKLHKELQTLCAQVPFGRCLCGKAALTKKVQFTDHVDYRHENKYKGITPHGHYCIPILSSGTLLGVLNLYVKEGHHRNKEEEDFLHAISHVLAGIIERKRAEVKLKLFRNLINQSNDAVFVIDPQTNRFLDSNDRACTSLGYKRNELLSMGVKDIEAVIPNSFSWKKHVREVRKKGNMVLEGAHKRKDGTTFPVEVSVKYLAQDKKHYLVAVARDITERKQIEAELVKHQQYLEELVEERTSKLTKTNKQLRQEIKERKRAEKELIFEREKLRKIYENSPDAVVVLDKECKILYANKIAEKISGVTVSEMKGKKCYETITGLDTFCDGCMVETVIKEKKSKNRIKHEVTAKGKENWLWQFWYPVLNTEGEIDCIVEIAKNISELKKAEESLQNALTEVKLLKNRLQAENIYLQDEIKLEHNFEEIISHSEELKKVLRKVEQVASTDATVLILGETGTGKELLARAIHNTSKRIDRPLVKVNCAAIPANLIESELFGHEKGAFTGALTRKIGRFELADGGTIFLDEIGDLPLELQAKLLRVLQEGEFERLGSTHTIKVNVRIIAATNRNLEKTVETGSFRQDLYYRLNVFPIKSPSLRDHKDDIPLLVNHFIKKYNAKLGKKIENIPQKVMGSLQAYHWPGNIRELENIVERSIILTNGSTLQLDELFDRPSDPLNQAENLTTIKMAERSLILKTLEESNWMVGGKRGAAVRLGVAPSTLRDRIKKLGLKKPH
jgi:PAS domain S-box-containing protein